MSAPDSIAVRGGGQGPPPTGSQPTFPESLSLMLGSLQAADPDLPGAPPHQPSPGPPSGPGRPGERSLWREREASRVPEPLRHRDEGGSPGRVGFRTGPTLRGAEVHSRTRRGGQLPARPPTARAHSSPAAPPPAKRPQQQRPGPRPRRRGPGPGLPPLCPGGVPALLDTPASCVPPPGLPSSQWPQKPPVLAAHEGLRTPPPSGSRGSCRACTARALGSPPTRAPLASPRGPSSLRRPRPDGADLGAEAAGLTLRTQGTQSSVPAAGQEVRACSARVLALGPRWLWRCGRDSQTNCVNERG